MVKLLRDEKKSLRVLCLQPGPDSMHDGTHVSCWQINKANMKLLQQVAMKERKRLFKTCPDCNIVNINKISSHLL